MVKEGLGITMTLGYAKTWVDEQGLVMIPIHEPQIGYEFLLYKHRQRSQTPAMKSFENFFGQSRQRLAAAYLKNLLILIKHILLSLAVSKYLKWVET